MLSLNDTGSGKLMDRHTLLLTICSCKYKLCFTGTGHLHLHGFIDITIRMSGNCDRFFPILYAGFNALHLNWCTKDGSIKHCTDRSVGTLPHFLQVVLRHTCSIRRDCRTFNCNTVLLGRICGIYSHLIICLISVFQP